MLLQQKLVEIELYHTSSSILLIPIFSNHVPNWEIFWSTSTTTLVLMIYSIYIPRKKVCQWLEICIGSGVFVSAVPHLP